MESSAAPRDGGEREAPENSNSIRLQRAQELLELLAAAGVDRRPLRAVVPDAAALDGFRDGWVGVDRPAEGPEANMRLNCHRELRDGLARVLRADRGPEDLVRALLAMNFDKPTVVGRALADRSLLCSRNSSYGLGFLDWVIIWSMRSPIVGAPRDLYACRDQWPVDKRSLLAIALLVLQAASRN